MEHLAEKMYSDLKGHSSSFVPKEVGTTVKEDRAPPGMN